MIFFSFFKITPQKGQKYFFQDQVRKNLSNDKILEVYVAISQKKISCTIFDKKQNERKFRELTVW